MTQDSLPLETSPRIEDARRQYVELFGSALVMNTYLKIALLGVSIVAVGLLVLNFRTIKKYESLKPLVIRIDDIGRAQAVQYDTLTYQPQGQAPELKYFLTQFVTQHFARMRATVKELRRHTADTWFVTQHNPPEGQKHDFTLPRKIWREAHRIVGRQDPY